MIVSKFLPRHTLFVTVADNVFIYSECISYRASKFKRLLFSVRLQLALLWIYGGLYNQVVIAEESWHANEPANGKFEIVAPVESYDKKKQTLQIFGYPIKITKKTKFQDRNRETIPSFDIEPGQWLKVKAKKKNGELVAKKIRKIGKRALYVSIVENDTDTTIIPKKKGKTIYRHPLQTFLENDATGVAFKLRPTENLLLGGKMEFSARTEDERDLNTKKKKDQRSFFAALRLDLLWKIGNSGAFALIEPSFQYFRVVSENREVEVDAKNTERLSRGHIFVPFLNYFAVDLGRQDFIDERQWLYDEVLDAARLYMFSYRVQLDLSMSTGRKEWDVANKHQDIDNLIADARYYLNRHHFFSLWYVDRNDSTERNFSPTVYGIRSLGRPKKGLRYWLELARSEGEAGDFKIDGYGGDVGINYVFNTRPRPYFTLGVAYGSGDKDNVKQKGAFRQTGLQDNSDKFGGVRRLQYYGEVMDPELSNKIISTIGIGIRPVPSLSIDTVYHTYRQVETSKDLGDTRIKAKPNGESPDLGQGLDLVIGFRKREFSMELTVGRFEPGEAFNKKDPSHKGQLQMEYKF